MPQMDIHAIWLGCSGDQCPANRVSVPLAQVDIFCRLRVCAKIGIELMRVTRNKHQRPNIDIPFKIYLQICYVSLRVNTWFSA